MMKEVAMHARVVTVKGQVDKLKDGIKIYTDSVLPAAEQQKGFKGLILLTDPKTGKSITMTLWDTETDMVAGESSGYFKEQIGKFMKILTESPVMEHYEVSVQSLGL